MEMSEWDRRFAKIVADTERHLASVKSQLHDPANLRPLDSDTGHKTSSRGSSLPSSPQSSRISRGPVSPSSILRNSRPFTSSMNVNSEPRSIPVSDNFNSLSPIRKNVSFDLNDASTLRMLSKRIQDQQEEIITLRENLTSMQFNLKQQHHQIRRLKDEMQVLQLKVSEDTKTEKKLLQFQQEVAKELEALKKRLPPAGGKGNRTDSNFCSLREERVRSMDASISSLQRELSSLKIKMAAQESKFGGMTSEITDVERRQDKLSKAVSEVKETQRKEKYSHKTTSTSPFSDHSSSQASQLQRLRDLLLSLEQRVESVEESVLSSSNDGPSSVQSYGTTSHTHHRVPFNPLTMSDLKRSAALSSRDVLSVQERKGNPLLYDVGQPDKLKFAEDDLSVSTLEGGSELDGHSLTCSLELMSDDVEDYDHDLNSDLGSDEALSLSS